MPGQTLTTLDTLQSTFESVDAFGEQRLWDALQVYFDYHNAQMQFFMNELIAPTTMNEMVFGSTGAMNMTEVDQFGRNDAQAVSFGTRCGVPLRMYDGTLQWTRKYFLTASVKEVTGQFLTMMGADRERVKNEAMRAFFAPTNYDFNDMLVNRRTAIPLKIRRLVNADSEPIPMSPNGQTFNGGSHTHYLATNSLAAADISALIDTVAEHYTSGEVILAINKASFAAVKGFTSNFVGYNFAYIDPSVNREQANTGRRRTINSFDQAVGRWDDVEVWVKPWVPPNYMVAYLSAGPDMKPLAFRTRTPTSGNLEIQVEDERYPLRARTYGREFGIACVERTAMAVLRTNNASYAAPTIA